MADNAIEIAPIGTRDLFRAVGKHLREDEAGIRGMIVREGDLAEGDERTPTSTADLALVNAAADRPARLAGRVEALLAGWEE